MAEDQPRWKYKLFVPSESGVDTENNAQLEEYLNKTLGNYNWEVVAFWGKSILAKTQLPPGQQN